VLLLKTGSDEVNTERDAISPSNPPLTIKKLRLISEEGGEGVYTRVPTLTQLFSRIICTMF
jgi:hypothetical protein